ncbi:sulfatase-like hydrolase/transferase [Vallicoccus soli]|uniref:Sulfatase n=1 Tax=Vallicoccus soli TaxID=2339232 RepID=A0A3A3YVE9_9ACTN|nr:sulfatase-like hydrolase/transferase [Vallicoccus soli]RJK93844.1 sulfatase [Vallicoccus soli]
MTDTDVSRRSLLAAGGAGLLAAATTATAGAAAAAPPRGRPNVLWLLSEDNNPYLGAYGDPVARTPVLDALAEEGIVFETAYSPAPVCAPSRFSYLTGMYAESCGPAHHMRALGEWPERFASVPEHLRAAGYYATNNVKTDYNTAVDPATLWDESSATAHWRGRPEGAPFFAVFTDMTTHESSQFGAADGATDPRDVSVPAYLPDTPEVRADIAHYYDRMAVMDANVGKRLAELEADGLAEDTIVVYSADNGGVLPLSKRFATEDGLHVPLVVRVPEKWRHLAPRPPGSREDAPVDGVDIPATILAVCGVRVPDNFHGRSFLGRRPDRREFAFGQRSRMDERYDLQRTARDERYVYVRNYMPHRPYGQSMGYMWQQRSYQVWEQLHLEGRLDEVQERFWDPKEPEELYDVLRDPDCVRNLAGSERHRPRLRRMRRALDEHLLATNDNGFIPEGHPLEGYDDSRVPGAYPLGHVMRVAAMAAERDPANLPHLLDELGDDHEVVRYWAATGLLVLGGDAAPAVQEMARVLAEEESVAVRIPVAEALARLGHPFHAVRFLAETLDGHEDPRVRLQALNALTWVGTAALPYRDVVARAAEHPDEYLRNAGRYLGFVLDGTYTPTSPVFGGF